MNYLKLLSTVIILSILSSCAGSETNPPAKPKKKKIDEKEFLNHEIINDSIEYRIKEFNLKNSIERKVCVFKNDKVVKEELIYKIQKNYLRDEDYRTELSKIYEVKGQNKIEVYDITTHYFDYKIESIDTTVSQVFVAPDGEIKISK
ncbi:MAG: hypothetical protein ABF258_05645 [Flavobacteriales bacterium]